MRILILLPLLALRLAAAEAEAGPWRGDLEAAVAEARAAGRARPMAVLVSSPKCTWCHRMLAESADSPALARAAAEVVPVVLDAGERPDLAALLRVEAYPTLILINRAGAEVRRITGYLPPEDLATALRVLALNGDAQTGGDSPLARRIDPVAMARTPEGRAGLVAMLGRGPAAIRARVREALAATPEARPLLWGLLVDPTLAVRCDAAAILAGPGQDTHGYDAFADAATREAQAAAWRQAVEASP